MNEVNNDVQMREAIAGLSATAQHQLAAAFVRNVSNLSDDERVRRAVLAAEADNDDTLLGNAYREAKAAALEAHARCGADGEWNDQAGYFVARAAEAAVAPQVRSHAKPPAWQAALSCRMARTAQATETDEDAHEDEIQAQYRILNEFLTR